MTYQKPELFVLGLGGQTVRGTDTPPNESNDGKGASNGETGDAGATTSSSSGAYEADE